MSIAYVCSIKHLLLLTRYEYSHTTDRLWRKNRAPNQQMFGLCKGVDLNRNFGYKWADKVAVFWLIQWMTFIHFS